MIRLQKTKIGCYCFMAFWVLVTIAKLLQIGPILYPAIAIALLGMFFGDDSCRIGFALMLVPNIRMFDGLGTTFLVNILLFAPLVSKLISERRINSVALIHTIVLISLELVHIIAGQKLEYLIPNVVAISMLLYVETVLLDRNAQLDFPRITRMFAAGSIYSAVVFFIVRAQRYDMSIYFKGYGYRYEGYASDPNYFSLYMCLAIAMLFIIRTHKKRDIVYIFALIFIELFTLSKMALVILLLTILYFAGKAVLHGFSRRMRFIKYFLLLGIGIVAIFSQRIISVLNVTLSRLQQHNGTDINLDTATSGRSTLMWFYMGQLLYEPIMLLFGHGLQYNEIYAKNLSHNTFIDIVLSWGLVGLGVMSVIFYSLIKRLILHCPEKLTSDHFFPLAVVILSFFALSCLSASMFWWVICAALLPLKGIENENYYANDLRRSAGVQRRQVPA